MAYWITPSGMYYEGDRSSPSDAAISKRPSLLYVWENGTWREKTPAELDAEKTAQAAEQIKAFALLVLDEINILRTAAGLQPRTVQQMINALKSKL